MANVNCEACSEIREIDGNLLVNGWSNTECTSFKNDKGLSPSSGHNDCTDLDLMDDCLIGNLDAEIDAYEVCDWKEFMHKLIPNLWTMFKAIGCAICGLWTNIHKLITRTDDLCALIDQIASPVLLAYGSLPLADASVVSARRCGTESQYVYRMPDDGTLNPYTKKSQNIGIAYARQEMTGCTNGRTQVLEWIAPNHYYYKIKDTVSYGDVIWKISKSEAQSKIGISDHLWQVFTESNWMWNECVLFPSRQVIWIKLTVGEHGLTNNEMGLVFMGCTAPNDAFTEDQQINTLNNASAKLYRHFK